MRKRTIIGTILIFFSTCLLSQAPASEEQLLMWNKSQRLAFEDFQAKIPESNTTTNDGGTHSLARIVKGIEVNFKTERQGTTFTIYAAMKRNLSWIKNQNDSVALAHEQGHFDICEIYARILRRDIQKTKSLDEAKQLFDKIVVEEELEQDKFDDDNSSTLVGITDLWKKKILKRLAELDQYSEPIVKLPFVK